MSSIEKEKNTCSPIDIGLKSSFLGPNAENAEWLSQQINLILNRWFNWRKSLFPDDGSCISNKDKKELEFLERQKRLQEYIATLALRLESEVPKFSPRYVGHMFSELSMPAILGHFMALLHNPNIISGEVAQVGVQIENEAITFLGKMIGYPENRMGHGHFTSGGTIANFEAMVRARARMALWLSLATLAKLKGQYAGSLFQGAHMGWEAFHKLNQALGNPGESALLQFNVMQSNPFIAAEKISQVFGQPYLGPIVLVPQNKHYSWTKGVELLGLGQDSFWSIDVNETGHMDIPCLIKLLLKAERESRPVLLVVTVAGSTELGSIDPVDQVQDLLTNLQTRKNLFLWHHIDAAFGGFFNTMDLDACPLEQEVAYALKALPSANSVTLDPHKLGYVPYSSGAILVREKEDYLINQHGAPYIQYAGLDRGPYTIEGSRPATGAAATWMIAKAVGLDPDGYGRILARTIMIKKSLEAMLKKAGLPIRIAPGGDSNILCFTVAEQGEKLSVTNQRARSIFSKFSPESRAPFIISKTILYEQSYARFIADFLLSWLAERDQDQIVLLRLCLLNPFFDSKEMNLNASDEFLSSLQEALKGSF